MITKKLTFSAIIIALYIVIMLFTLPISYNLIQMRLATSLYALSGLFPFLIIPLGIANALGNYFGNIGFTDVIGGFFVGIITASLVYLIVKSKLNDAFMILPLIFGPSLIVPLWLHIILNMNYFIVAGYLSLGQIIPAILGFFLYKEIKKRFKGLFTAIHPLLDLGEDKND